MGMGRAYKDGMPNALFLNIVDEFAAASDEGVVLDAGIIVMV
jgi:hypothetical protein